MNDLEKQLEQQRQGLERIEKMLANTSEEYRREVMQALRDAAGIGAWLQEMKLAASLQPIDGEGKLLLGRALQEHLKKARDIHSKIHDLEADVHETFDEYSQAA